MPDAQTQTPDQTAPPQAVAGTNTSLNQGLGIGTDAMSNIGLPPSFGSDVQKMQGIIDAPPTQAFQNLATAQGDVLKAQQDQAKAEAEATDKALTQYGSTANQALQRYDEQMAGSPLPAFVPTQETASDLASLGGMVAVLGFMVGRGKGMQPGLAALDSMTGMLKGWSQGRRELYENELKTFKENFDKLRVAHEEYVTQLKQALDVSKVDLEKGMADAKLAAVKAGDQVTAKQINALGAKAVIDAINAQNGVREKAVKIIADLDAKQMARQAIPLDPQTLDWMAQQYWAGDKSVLQGLGYGNAGAANRIALRQAISRYGAAHNLSPSDLAAKLAQYSADTAGMRTIAQRGAAITMAAEEAKKSAVPVLELAAKTPRGTFVPLNRAILAGKAATGDPFVAKFRAALNTYIQEYARAVAPTGVPTNQIREHAYELLDGAYSYDQIKNVLDQLDFEMNIALQAPQDAMQIFSTNITGEKPPAMPPSPSQIVQPSNDSGWKIEKVQ
jgi:hypothetical protein